MRHRRAEPAEIKFWWDEDPDYRTDADEEALCQMDRLVPSSWNPHTVMGAKPVTSTWTSVRPSAE